MPPVIYPWQRIKTKGDLMFAFRSGLVVALLIVFSVGTSAVMAGENPYPRKWFWGDDDQRATHDAMIGRPAPDIVLTDWINGRPTGKSIKNKIVVVDIWATWCGPCIGAIPHNNEMADHYAKDGVVVVGVCGSKSGQDKMERIAKDHGIKYPVGKDSTYKVAAAWNTMWWPTYAVVDRNRIVRAVGLKPSYVDEVIDALLEEQPYQVHDGDNAVDHDADEPADEDKDGGDEAGNATGAQIDAAWLEGDADQRERFAGLEGYAPPALAVGNWINSEGLTLADLKGKVVLLDFWATWCGPCIGSIPHTNELRAQYAKDGLIVIGVCNTRGGEHMAQTASDHQIEYPIAVDINGQTDEAYHVNGYPDYYLIDRTGVLRIADCKNGSVDDAVQALLNEPYEPSAVTADASE